MKNIYRITLVIIGIIFGTGIFVNAQTPGGINVYQGGTGVTSIPNGGFLYGTGGIRVGATSSPTVGWITATSTTATSSFSGPILKNNIPIESFSPFSPYYNNPILYASSTDTGKLNAWGSVVKSGDTFYFYFTNKSSGTDKIFRATSSDGKSWTFDDDNNPMLVPTAGKFDYYQVWLPIVWIENNVWYMIYTGFGSSYGIGLATSNDGVTWTKQNSGNAVLTGTAGQWDEGDVEAASVIKVGSTYYLHYNNVATRGTSRKSGVATSNDLITWTKDINNPTFSDGNFCATVFKYDGKYYAVYPHYTVGTDNSDYSEFQLYSDSNPTFYPTSRQYLGVVKKTSALDWDKGDEDTPFVLTDDITRDSFDVTNGDIWMYYSGTDNASIGWQTGLLISTHTNSAWSPYIGTKTGEGAAIFGTVGVGTSSPYAKLSINLDDDDLVNTVFAVSTTSPTATSSLMTILKSGFTGLGTNNPQRLLHLSFDNGIAETATILALENTNTTDLTSATMSWRTNTTGAGAANFQELSAIQGKFEIHDHATRNSSLGFYTSNGSETEKMRILGNGNIGIGTTSPYSKLAVVGETVSTYFTATSSNATSTFNGNVNIGGGMPLIRTGGLFATPATLTVANNVNDLTANIVLANMNTGVYSAGCLSYENGNSTNEGIYSKYYASTCFTGPNFAVYSGAPPNTLVTINTDGAMGWAVATSSITNQLMFWGLGPGYQSSNYDMVFAANNASQVPRLGIGSTTPGAKLSVAHYSNDTAPTMLISTSTSIATSTAFVVDTNGRVGIGTSSPSGTNPFTVQGTSFFSDAVGIGTSPTILAGGEARLNVNGGKTWTTSSWAKGIRLDGINTLEIGGYSSTKFGMGSSGGGLYHFYTTTETNTGDSAHYYYTVDSSGNQTFGTSALYVANGGNVALGNTTVTATLNLFKAGATAANSPSIMFTASTTAISMPTQPWAWMMGVDNADQGKFKIASSATSISTNTRLTIDGNGDVGIGTTNPTSLLSLGTAAGLKLALYDGGTPDTSYGFGIQSGRMFAQNSVGTELMSWTSANNVGIATTTPGSKLQVNFSATPATQTVGLNNTNGVSFTAGGLYGTYFGLLSAGTTYIQGQRFDGTGTSYNISLNPGGGNVGVGTSTPTLGKFMVTTGAKQEFIVKATPALTGISDYSVAGVSSWYTEPATNSVVNGLFSYNTAAGLKNFGIYAYNDLVFAPGSVGGVGAERMRILSGGGVGIGTTTPATKLVVSGDDAALGSEQLYLTGVTDPRQRLRLGYNTTSSYGVIQAVTINSSFDPLSINPSGGNVGIGTTSPGYLLEVGDGTTNKFVSIHGGNSGTSGGSALLIRNNMTNIGAVGNPSAILGGAFDNTNGIFGLNGLNFYTSSGGYRQRMIINTSGNIGIGTSTPSSKLSITANSSSAISGLYLEGVNSNTGNLFSISTSTAVATTTALSVNNVGKMIYKASSTPSSSTEACVAGTITYDKAYVYICVTDNQWYRAQILTW